ncbi:hypothetical protein OAX78_03625, partial [Planctomycetota bacterium]|nr:hypothetical protein [Planctomycetota bacterium]
MASLRALSTGALLLTLALFCPTPAEAQVSVQVDQVPTQVQPGETFEIVWTVSSPDPVALTAVIWGEHSGALDRVGDFFDGPAGTFRASLTAPASGTIH